MPDSPPPKIVVKIGGKLLHTQDLGPRLTRFLATLKEPDILLVPGGGQVVNEIRELDRLHRLGEEKSHWLALQGMALTARILGALLPRAAVVENLEMPASGGVAILDAYAWCRRAPNALPATWELTSDSIAAAAAIQVNATQLILLKSATLPPGMSWRAASDRGFVDPLFPQLIARATNLKVTAINFREWPDATVRPAAEHGPR